MTNEISNSDDVIDSRDVIARIEELEEERQDLVDALDKTREAHNEVADKGAPDVAVQEYAENVEEAREALAEWDRENAKELKALQALAEEAEGYAPDWQHGETLIRYSYFTEYVQELLEDCGDLPKGLPHYVVIDWEATARNIKVDYTEVDFDGVTYLVR